MKVKITKISRYTHDKQGNQLKTKDGKPYQRVIISTPEHPSVSGFGSKETNNWNEGSEIDIDITKKGQYINFTIPKPQSARIDDNWKKEIEFRLETLEQWILNQKKDKENPIDNPF